MTNLLKWFFFFGFIGFLTLGLFEVALGLNYKYLNLSPLPEDLLRELYLKEYRNVIQSDPNCVVFDETTTYRLKTGSCTFSNFEFDTSVTANSIGLRDSESAIDAPEVIFLGDSVTMGWGVEDDETFPSIFKRSTGLRVLNAGISSYGTPRELQLLGSLDTKYVKTIVIQYSANDLRETKEFAEKGLLATISKDRFWQIMSEYQEHISYFPGRHSLVALYYLWRGVMRNASVEIANETALQTEIDYLIDVLESFRLPADARLYLFEQNECYLARPQFSEVLRKRLLSRPASSSIREMAVLDFTPYIDPSMCFSIDGHINNLGHKRIAELLVDSIVSDRTQ